MMASQNVVFGEAALAGARPLDADRSARTGAVEFEKN